MCIGKAFEKCQPAFTVLRKVQNLYPAQPRSPTRAVEARLMLTAAAEPGNSRSRRERAAARAASGSTPPRIGALRGPSPPPGSGRCGIPPGSERCGAAAAPGCSAVPGDGGSARVESAGGGGVGGKKTPGEKGCCRDGRNSRWQRAGR